MPIYEYECHDCGKKFDLLRPMREADTPIACVKCDSMQTSRLLSRFNAHSGGQVVAGGGSSCGCAGCSGGSCAGCGH